MHPRWLFALSLVACHAPPPTEESIASESRRRPYFADVRAIAAAEGVDDTTAAQRAVERIRWWGGGVLFFSGGIYDLRDTIRVPSNTVVQGISSGAAGTNQLRLVTPDRALFEVEPGAQRVVFRDLELRALVHGPENWNGFPGMVGAFERDRTTAIRMSAGGTREITIKNLRVSLFTRGIEVLGGSGLGPSDVRIRDVSADRNNTTLFIDAPGATRWDVQNLNIINLTADPAPLGAPLRQDGVVVSSAGDLAFLELSCGSTWHDGGVCLEVFEHGRLYLRGLFSEGPHETARVHPSKTSSDRPIFLHHSALGNGLFVEDDVEIVSVGSFYCAQDCPEWQGRASLFSGDGARARVRSCGDMAGRPDQWDLPMFELDPVFVGLEQQPTPCDFDVGIAGGPEFVSELAPWESAAMPYYATAGQYYVAPSGDPAVDTAAIQAALEAIRQSSGHGNGAVFLGPGTFFITDTLRLRAGVTLQGTPGATVLELVAPPLDDVDEVPLLQIVTEYGYPQIGIGIMDLTLRASPRAARGRSFTGLSVRGCSNVGCANAGYVQDLRLHRLRIEGFDRGLFFRPEALEANGIPNRSGNPMIDTVSIRDVTIARARIGVDILSNNGSNMNVEGLAIVEMGPDAIGVQLDGPHLLFRELSCEAAWLDRPAEVCLKLKIAGGSSLYGLQTAGMRRALHVHSSRGYAPWQIVVGHSDLSEGVFIEGRANLLSHDSVWPEPGVGLTFGSFHPEHPDRGGNPLPGTMSRVRFCGDTFGAAGTEPRFSGLDHPPVFCARGGR